MSAALSPFRLACLLSAFIIPATLCAQEAASRMGGALPLVKSQAVYLPVYSHIYHGSLDRKGKPGKTLLSAQVSIRNTDAKNSLRVTSARYRNTEGQVLREFITTARSVPPFGALELFVEQHDETGGSGANFAILWEASVPINPPLIEAVHATIEGARSVVFTTSGVPVSEDR